VTRDKKDMNKYGKEWRYRYNRDYQLNAIEGLKRDREYVESQKRAWQEASKALPDDAFADDVKVCEPVGTYRRKSVHVPSKISNDDVTF